MYRSTSWPSSAAKSPVLHAPLTSTGSKSLASGPDPGTASTRRRYSTNPSTATERRTSRGGTRRTPRSRHRQHARLSDAQRVRSYRSIQLRPKAAGNSAVVADPRLLVEPHRPRHRGATASRASGDRSLSGSAGSNACHPGRLLKWPPCMEHRDDRASVAVGRRNLHNFLQSSGRVVLAPVTDRVLQAGSVGRRLRRIAERWAAEAVGFSFGDAALRRACRGQWSRQPGARLGAKLPRDVDISEDSGGHAHRPDLQEPTPPDAAKHPGSTS